MPTKDGQYHTDEFIGEVIGIDLMRDFRIVIPDTDERPRPDVKAIVAFGRGPASECMSFTGRGKTMGFALADVRQQVREHYGR